MKTPEYAWVKEFPGGVTVCDTDGTILGMNDKAASIFEEDGGRALIGKNVFDCHPEPARSELQQLMEARQRRICRFYRTFAGSPIRIAALRARLIERKICPTHLP